MIQKRPEPNRQDRARRTQSAAQAHTATAAGKGRPLTPGEAAAQAVARCAPRQTAGAALRCAPRQTAGAALRFAAALPLLLAAAACATGTLKPIGTSPGTPPATAAGGTRAGTAAGTAIPGNVSENYIIGAGDSLSVFVYRNPDLSEGGVAVRPDGRISTPLIEDIVAAGKTPTQLAREIEQKLSKYVQDPNVTVIVRSFIGPADRQVRVIGEAADPIAIPYRDHMTLLDVMIATKGLTKFASGNRATIVRLEPEGQQQVIKVRLSDLIKDGDISQNVEMKPGDTLIIPQSWF